MAKHTYSFTTDDPKMAASLAALLSGVANTGTGVSDTASQAAAPVGVAAPIAPPVTTGAPPVAAVAASPLPLAAPVGVMPPAAAAPIAPPVAAGPAPGAVSASVQAVADALKRGVTGPVVVGHVKRFTNARPDGDPKKGSTKAQDVLPDHEAQFVAEAAQLVG